MALIGNIPVRGFDAGDVSAIVTRGFHAPAIATPVVTVECPEAVLGTVGVAFSSTVVATGGTPPYTFAIGSGSLPTGLTMGIDGVITGTPTVPGTFPFSLSAIDAMTVVGTTSCSITIAAAVVLDTGSVVMCVDAANPGDGEYIDAYSGLDGSFIQHGIPLSPHGIGYAQAGAVLPSNGHVYQWGIHEASIPDADNLFEWDNELIQQAVTSIPWPSTGVSYAWIPNGICFDGSDVCYIAWIGSLAIAGHYAMQQLQAGTFAVLNTYIDFDGGAGVGTFRPGAVTVDGSTYYYSFGDSSSATANVIRKLAIPGGTASTFATYSTWNAGTVTGYQFNQNCLQTDTDDNVYAVARHTTGGVVDGARLLKFDSAGTLLLDYPVSFDTVATTVEGMAVTPDMAYMWIILHHQTLQQYRLSDGVRTINSSAPNGFAYGSLSITGVAGPPPPMPVLHIAKVQQGTFFRGQMHATYQLAVSNSGAATSAPIVVHETLPSGLSLVSMSGPGWTCVGNVCCRHDVLDLNETFPLITVTVNVASDATSPQVNLATVTSDSLPPASATVSTPLSDASNACVATLPLG
jgi:uncharacterized repeat protein (TIGR01451 family)